MGVITAWRSGEVVVIDGRLTLKDTRFNYGYFAFVHCTVTFDNL